MSQLSPPGPYREVTLPAILLGVFFGVMLVACFTYAGLLIGFTIGGSAVAAILGFGVLRKGSIVENNINQTIASAINITTAGIIFTVPAFYLMDVAFNPVLVGVAAVAGVLLGIFFIIPIRKQMIDLDRLRFPTGTAVAAILKSPGVGVEKSRLLVIGMAISAVVYFSQFPIRFSEDSSLFGVTTGLIPASIDLGAAVGLPGYIDNVWAISLFSFRAGFITGRPGLVVRPAASSPIGSSRRLPSRSVGCQASYSPSTGPSRERRRAR